MTRSQTLHKMDYKDVHERPLYPPMNVLTGDIAQVGGIVFRLYKNTSVSQKQRQRGKMDISQTVSHVHVSDRLLVVVNQWTRKRWFIHCYIGGTLYYLPTQHLCIYVVNVVKVVAITALCS